MSVATGSAVQSPTVAEVLRDFLSAQRLAVTGPVLIDRATRQIATDDDYSLLNTFVAYEPDPAAPDPAPDLEALLRANLDPSRTDMIVPDRLAASVPRLNGAVRGLVRRVVPLSEFLDGRLRPKDVCDELINGDSRDVGTLDINHFVEQRAYVQGRGEVSSAGHLFRGWARGQGSRLCIVLAPAGHGKSMITRELAKRIARSYRQAPPADRPPVPILIPFGHYRRSTSFTGLILEALNRFGNTRLTIEAFQYLISLRRVLFILDGYDEMVEANPETARENISLFVQSAGPASRILLTSRSTFYRTSSDVVGQVSDPLLVESDVEVIDLLPFNKSEAREYLRKRLGDAPDPSRALERAQTLLEHDDNLEILGSPIFLYEFANSVAKESWRTADIRKLGSLRFLVERTFSRERERQNHEYTNEQQRRFLEGIAFDLLTSGSSGYLREDLEIFVAEAVDDDLAQANWSALASHHFLADDRSGTPMVTMRHQVWRDYFQGCALAARLNDGNAQARYEIGSRDLPEGVLRSASGILGEPTRSRLLGQTAGNGDKLIRNLLRMWLLRREPGTRKPAPIPDDLRGLLGGRDLSGLSFTGVDFGGADLSRSDLSGCYLKRCDLTGARLAGTVLDRTTLHECEVPPEIADATTASVTIDDAQYFGPQLREHFRPQAVAVDGGRPKDDFAKWVTTVLRDRLGKFVKARMGENNIAVDEAISWTAFMGGTDPQHRDFVVRRLYRALHREKVVYEGKMNSTGRPTVVLSENADTRADVVTFVRTGVTGPAVRAVIDQLVGHR